MKILPPAGIYVHWPFCEHKCPYCDFYTFGRGHAAFIKSGDYLSALVEEIESAPTRLNFPSPPAADTIYFGGGTPSLMGAEACARILNSLRTTFQIDPKSEITLEINPTTAETAGLDEYLKLGVNRLSVGCQSFDDNILRALGRTHDATTARRALALIRALGVDNLSLDIIFGAPGQSLDHLRRDIETILSFNPEHVSAYGLTIHEKTPFDLWRRQGRLVVPDEDAQAEMFECLLDALAAAGYEHYEISNWSRPDRASRHNSKYWMKCDVYGFGVAAHGVVAGRRMANRRDLHAYIQRQGWAEPLDPPRDERARCGEIVMLALRRTAGVSWAELNEWMGRDAREFYADEWSRLEADNLIARDETTLRLTRRGLLLADTVMETFFLSRPDRNSKKKDRRSFEGRSS